MRSSSTTAGSTGAPARPMDQPLDGLDRALMERVAARVAEARDRIARAGGDPGRIRIVAVTKGFGPDEVVGRSAQPG